MRDIKIEIDPAVCHAYINALNAAIMVCDANLQLSNVVDHMDALRTQLRQAYIHEEIDCQLRVHGSDQVQ